MNFLQPMVIDPMQGMALTAVVAVGAVIFLAWFINR